MTQCLMCEIVEKDKIIQMASIPFYFCREIKLSLDMVVRGGLLDSLDEGVELGYRLNENEWIPLMWYSSQDNNRDDWIKVGMLTNSNLMVRGFNVPFVNGDTHKVALKLCGSEIIENAASLSFRWLQTVNSTVQPSIDDIAIDDVYIGIKSSILQVVLLADNFDNQMTIK